MTARVLSSKKLKVDIDKISIRLIPFSMNRSLIVHSSPSTMSMIAKTPTMKTITSITVATRWQLNCAITMSVKRLPWYIHFSSSTLGTNNMNMIMNAPMLQIINKLNGMTLLNILLSKNLDSYQVPRSPSNLNRKHKI